MKNFAISLLLAGMLSSTVFAAENQATQPSPSSSTSTSGSSATSASDAATTAASSSTGTAAGVDTALAASAGGLTATVLAVGVAAVVIGVAVSDSGGGDDPAPPVTAAVE